LTKNTTLGPAHQTWCTGGNFNGPPFSTNGGFQIKQRLPQASWGSSSTNLDDHLESIKSEVVGKRAAPVVQGKKRPGPSHTRNHKPGARGEK